MYSYILIKIIINFINFQDSDLLSYLKEQIESKEKELFIVVLHEIASSQRWLAECNGENFMDTNEESIDYKKESTIENINNHNTCNNGGNEIFKNGNFCNDQSSR